MKIKPLEVVGDISASELYSEFPILIEARAGYHQCGIFINKLENMERFIRIDEVDIKGRSGDPGPACLSRTHEGAAGVRG